MKHFSTQIPFRIYVASVSLLAIFSCQPVTHKAAPPPAPVPPVKMEKIYATDAGEQLSVAVEAENVRSNPNGKKLGELTKGDSITVIKRVGNWVAFQNPQFQQAYIWAPSVGYDYQNLYSPFFYFDTTANHFRNIDFFRHIFSQHGQRRPNDSNTYELFFKDIGLGSHETLLLDVDQQPEQLIEHGTTLFINMDSEQIMKTRVDYLRPVKGAAKALQKSELTMKSPPIDSDTYLSWQAGLLLKNLTVILERKEPGSNWFTSIWYVPENRQKADNR